MKLTKIFTFCVFAVIFSTGILKSFTVRANEEEGGAKGKLIVGTICCANGLYTGNANNCTTGDYSCTNHNCAQGETEVLATGSCMGW